MKKADLKVGSVVEVIRNKEKVQGMIVELGTYKAEIAFEQTLENVESEIGTTGIVYRNILKIIEK